MASRAVGDDANGAGKEQRTAPGPVSGEEAPAAPASDAQLAHWKAAVRSEGLGVRLSETRPEAAPWPLVLHALMVALGPPRALDTSVDIVEETDALDAVSTPDAQGNWARLPRNAQQAWLAVLVARTRALKELPTASAVTRGKVKEIIARYPGWAKEHAPGHVNGMQTKHAPMHGSWAKDARSCWAALGELLGDQTEVRTTAPPGRRPKPATTKEQDEQPDIEPDWPLLPLFRGRSAVIFGGDPREPNRKRLERAFLLASLEWPPIDGPRKVEAAIERIRQGRYDLVLVLGPFVFHAQSDPLLEAAKEAGVTWALVDGYGVAAVRLGLERFCGG